MRIASSTGRFSAALIIVLGIWGALIPFVGPYFDYAFAPNSSWHYTADRLWLCILPGALAVLAGVMLFSAASRYRGILGGWLAVLAGAWFAVGPAVSATWEHAQGPIGAPLYGTTRQALELIGYFYGLGALIVALGAFSIGRFSARPSLAAKEVIARARRTEPEATDAPAAEEPRPAATHGARPVATEEGSPAAAGEARPPQRRGLLRRRRAGARRPETPVAR
jgi:hypothetical protein